MAKGQLPFRLHYADTDTRRLVAVVICGLGGGLGFGLALAWATARSGGWETLSVESIRAIWAITVVTGIVFGGWAGSRWKPGKPGSTLLDEMERARGLGPEDFPPLTKDMIIKDGTNLCPNTSGQFVL